jgi:protein phosphatase
MKLVIPELALVVLIGPSGSGKSTFASRHFVPTEVISSDFCRGMVADDENDQAATPAAFRVLQSIASERLCAGRLTVVDATNVQAEARRPLVELAKQQDCLAVAIVFDVAERICADRNRQRPNRNLPSGVIHRQRDQMRRSLRGLQREGFRYIFVLDSPDAVDAAVVERQRLWVNRRDDHGPFDIVGDVHGCLKELEQLLGQLGYKTSDAGMRHPEGRRLIFVGDLVDRGPDTPGVLRLVMPMVRDGQALCVAGNHDQKLVRALKGRNVQVSHGLAQSLAQLESEPEVKSAAVDFLDGLISHYVLDDGKLAVAHAGMREEYMGRASGRVREFALYGETTGEVDQYGLPIRLDWAQNYRGQTLIVYGHVAVTEPRWLNGTINIDTGCVFGGRLTALRYPERELVSVAAPETYFEPAVPLEKVGADSRDHEDLLDVADVLGKRIVETRLAGRVTVREENATAALEVMSRFAIDPRWLIYLPPTMSPTEATKVPGFLEHPMEAFAYYRKQGVSEVICEEKHMGSRAVVVVCRDEEAAVERFGSAPPARLGVCYTRTGRPMFTDGVLERDVLKRLSTAITSAGYWAEFDTEWICLDCELMPWSAKAQELLVLQYAPVACAGLISLGEALGTVRVASDRGVDLGDLETRLVERSGTVARYADAYGRYCWPVRIIDDVRLAPFHLLATEGAVHANKEHSWHMQQLHRLCDLDSQLLTSTPHLLVDLSDTAAVTAATEWWTHLTAKGGEGMVVKPRNFVATSARGLVQPGIKCRGHEYLRIIYGPEYDLPGNLERLRDRGSLALKRSLALREFALGVESLERFVGHEPAYRVHEAVFAVLALESEPVDPVL